MDSGNEGTAALDYSSETSHHSNNNTSSEFEPFQLQYELGSEVDRKLFLDSFQHFWTAQGHPCHSIPFADTSRETSFDLFLMYKAVAEKGGYSVVQKEKTDKVGPT